MVNGVWMLFRKQNGVSNEDGAGHAGGIIEFESDVERLAGG
jgi:hypothetical protein